MTDRSGAAEQIDLLAKFITNEIPGEPSQSEGAGECAIRYIREGWEQIDALRERIGNLRQKLADGAPIEVPDAVPIDLNHLVAAVAYESVRISPYPVPANLEAVLRGLHDRISAGFAEIAKGVGIYCATMTQKQLYSMVDEALKDIAVFEKWNITRNEQRQGKTEPGGGFVAVSRYSLKQPPDDDFVDLDAHIRNTVQLIWNEATEEYQRLRRPLS